VIGSVLLVELAAARLLFTADAASVYFLGHPIRLECSFKRAFGVPCPACGATRAFVLALHGSIGNAWSMNPIGPLAVIGMLAAGAALLAVATRPMLARLFRAAGLVYVGACSLIWAVSWLHTVF
jgi:hypothetical protein